MSTENKKKPIHVQIKDEVAKEIFALKGQRPNLAVVVFGECEECKARTADFEEEGKKVGIDINMYICGKEISEKEAFDMVSFLNEDELIDAIYIMRPIPENLDMEALKSAVKPEKDINFEEDAEETAQPLFEANLFKNTLVIFKERQKEPDRETED